jgi:DNA-binding XRE family transcriptional regulator
MSEQARDGTAPVVGLRASQRRGTAPADMKQMTAQAKTLDLSFAVWLSRQLRRQRISQRELARRGGLDHSTISRILVGARAPSWSTVQRIAQVVGFPPPNVLLGGLRSDWMPGDEGPARSRPRDELGDRSSS